MLSAIAPLVLSLAAPQEPVRLDLPHDLPARFVVTIPLADTALSLDLVKVSNRAADFVLYERGASGELIAVPAPPVATYRGAALGGEGIAAVSLDADGMTGLVWLASGERYAIEPTVAGAHSVRLAPALDLTSRCEALHAEPSTVPPHGEDGGGAEGAACLTVADIAFDVDFEFYQLVGSSSAQAVLDVETALNVGNLMYARDVQITHEVSTIIVQTSQPDPYTASDPGQLLDQFRTHWAGSMGAINRDVAHLITGREMTGSTIGLAYLTVICSNDWGYGLSQFTFGPVTNADILAHELGHNWSAPHCLDVGGTSVMCGGGATAIGVVTEQLILNYKATLPCLSSGAGFATQVPPNARDDHAERNEPGTIDVLANDFDGNCDDVLLVSADTASALGGSVQVSVGTGPGGRDEVLYTPPVGGVHGIDTFDYTAGDGLGGQATATVHVTDRNPDLIGHYKLDELAGFLALDASGHDNHGVYGGGVTLGAPGATGETGTSVRFDASNELVTLGTSWLFGDRKLTVTAWVNPDTTNGEQRILANTTSWAFGLSDTSLKFTLHQIGEFVLGPGAVSAGEWTHVAVVFDENLDLTFYRNGGVIGTIPGAMPAGAADGTWRIASLDGVSESFQGSLDDVQVYQGAMTGQQVLCAYESAWATAGFATTSGFLDLSAGGTQTMSLCSVGADNGGDLYFVLGTMSGTAPGFPLGGLHVPLNPDAYFNITLASPNDYPLFDSFASLNPSGHATTRFTLNPGTNPVISFATVHHAWALIDPTTFTVDWVSDPSPVLLLP